MSFHLCKVAGGLDSSAIKTPSHTLQQQQKLHQPAVFLPSFLAAVGSSQDEPGATCLSCRMVNVQICPTQETICVAGPSSSAVATHAGVKRREVSMHVPLCTT
jgi:hypothetical protein